MDYLHFIGKSYYKTPTMFIREALKYGVNRRVAPNLFKRMRLGDRIFLAQGDKKNSRIFGFFIFTSITGLNHDLIDRMRDKGLIADTPTRGSSLGNVERGCGSYTVSASYRISNPTQLMEELTQLDGKELGPLMIGGLFYSLEETRIRSLYRVDHICANIPFQQGFRPFDADGFFAEYERQVLSGRRNIRIIGMFYAKPPTDGAHKTGGKVLKISNYRRK
uniref:Uncharacterized protein n=2 Tax=viral metagenome TaxID=1070528 RepID=A0A6M3L1S3_9ZZZZ